MLTTGRHLMKAIAPKPARPAEYSAREMRCHQVHPSGRIQAAQKESVVDINLETLPTYMAKYILWIFLFK